MVGAAMQVKCQESLAILRRECKPATHDDHLTSAHGRRCQDHEFPSDSTVSKGVAQGML